MTRAGTTHPPGRPAPFFLLSSPPGKEDRKRRIMMRSRRGVACLQPIGQPPNRTSTRPHSIEKSLARPDPGQGRAATDSDTCQLTLHGNTRPPILVATVHTVPSSSHAGPHSLAAPKSQREWRTFLLPLLQWRRPWGRLGASHGPWVVDHGPWLMGTSHDVPLSPNHRHPPLCGCLFLPFPTRSPSGVHSVP